MEELILRIFKEKNVSSMDEKFAAKTIAEELTRIEKIKRALQRVESSKEIVRKEYEKKTSDFNLEITNIRSQCKHEQTQYHADASGNNDSWTQCLICGATV